MYPPLFELCEKSDEVKALLGTDILRLYLFDEAEENTPYPYAVWGTVSGLPFNTINCIPDADSFTVRVDVFAKTASEARQAAKAIRDAIERQAYISQWNGEDKDTETKAYWYSFNVEFITYR